VGGISVTELNVLEREFLAMIDWRLMCTREILQEYYVNLVRTHSTGKFVLAGSHTPFNSSENDMELDNNNSTSSNQLVPSSPIASTHHRLRPSISESSAILMDHSPSQVPEVIQPHPHPHRPTIEQNMAFAALQQSQQESNLTIGPITNPADRSI